VSPPACLAALLKKDMKKRLEKDRFFRLLYLLVSSRPLLVSYQLLLSFLLAGFSLFTLKSRSPASSVTNTT